MSAEFISVPGQGTPTELPEAVDDLSHLSNVAELAGVKIDKIVSSLAAVNMVNDALRVFAAPAAFEQYYELIGKYNKGIELKEPELRVMRAFNATLDALLRVSQTISVQANIDIFGDQTKDFSTEEMRAYLKSIKPSRLADALYSLSVGQADAPLLGTEIVIDRLLEVHKLLRKQSAFQVHRDLHLALAKVSLKGLISGGSSVDNIVTRIMQNGFDFVYRDTASDAQNKAMFIDDYVTSWVCAAAGFDTKETEKQVQDNRKDKENTYSATAIMGVVEAMSNNQLGREIDDINDKIKKTPLPQRKVSLLPGGLKERKLLGGPHAARAAIYNYKVSAFLKDTQAHDPVYFRGMGSPDDDALFIRAHVGNNDSQSVPLAIAYPNGALSANPSTAFPFGELSAKKAKDKWFDITPALRAVSDEQLGDEDTKVRDLIALATANKVDLSDIKSTRPQKASVVKALIDKRNEYFALWDLRGEKRKAFLKHILSPNNRTLDLKQLTQLLEHCNSANVVDFLKHRVPKDEAAASSAKLLPEDSDIESFAPSNKVLVRMFVSILALSTDKNIATEFQDLKDELTHKHRKLADMMAD